MSYLGQPTPGSTPELFAEGVVNTEAIELNAVFNQTMDEFFFTRVVRGNFIIYHSRFEAGQWSEPSPLNLFPDSVFNSLAVDMSLSPDGKALYFLGRCQTDSTDAKDLDIYVSHKTGTQWGPGQRMPSPINTAFNEYYPVIVADGSMYFVSNRETGTETGEVFRAQYLGKGLYEIPVRLDSVINNGRGAGDTYVSPDERYLIYSTRNQHGNSGLFISIKSDGRWQKPVHLGEPINSEWTDFCPYITPDGKYFFFSRRYSEPIFSGWSGAYEGKVFWVSAQVLLSKLME